MKLKQECNHPAHLLKDRSDLEGRSGKLARLEEILAEALAEGDKALCFTQCTEFGRMLKPHLQGGSDARSCSSVVVGRRRPRGIRLVRQFQAVDRPSLFVLSLKAGGTGLNDST